MWSKISGLQMYIPGTGKVREYLAGSRFFLESLYLVPDIDLGDTVFARVIDGDQADGGSRLQLLVGAIKFQHVQVGHMVTADNKEVLPVEIFLGIFDTAGCTELGLLVDVRDLGAEEGAVAKRFLNGIPHIAEREHNFAEAHVRKVCDQVLDRGAVDNRDTGLWPFERQGAETRPFPPAHNTHLHGT